MLSVGNGKLQGAKWTGASIVKAKSRGEYCPPVSSVSLVLIADQSWKAATAVTRLHSPHLGSAHQTIRGQVPVHHL